MAKQKKISDEDVLTSALAAERSCVYWAESKLSREAERVTRYYDATWPARQHDGNSSFISSDVYDGVESMKAQLLETFAGGYEIVRFNPHGPEDVTECRQKTSYIDNVVFVQNNGYEVFHDVIDDSLKGRNGVAAVYWEDEEFFDTVEFEDKSLEDVMALHAQPDVDELEAELDDDCDPQAPCYEGQYRIKRYKSRCRIEPIPQEEFFIEARVKRMEDGVRGRRTPKTKAELIADGYPRAKVMGLSLDARTTLDTPQALARDEQTATNSPMTLRDDPPQDELQTVMLFETYMVLDRGDGAQLHRIVHASDVLFECEPVEEDPYVAFVALRRPHTWWGNNYAARIIPTQNARTVLIRGILDHTAITNNPRYSVVQGGLLNPRELMDNRLGGIVNTTRPDAITPLMQSSLNPFVFEAIKLLDEKKEETTGISSLSQGLSKDAVSKQNSQGLVNDLVALSQVRQKIIARNFANSFLLPLYRKVYKLVQRNDTQKHVVEVLGELQVIEPSKWSSEAALSLSLQLGYGEQEKEAAKYVQTYSALANDPGAAALFPIEKRYNLLAKCFVKNGIREFPDYIVTADKANVPGPDPVKMLTAQAAMKTAEASDKNAQAALLKVQNTANFDTLKVADSAHKTAVAQFTAERNAERQDADTANRIDVSQRELVLAEQVPPADQRGIFSPNS